MKIEIDVAELDAFVKSEYPAQVKKFKGKRAEAEADGVQMAAIDIPGNLDETFCDLWRTVRPWINRAIGLLGAWDPAMAARARVVVAAINKYFVPLVCTPK